MAKKSKLIIAILLCFILVLTMMPVDVFAKSGAGGSNGQRGTGSADGVVNKSSSGKVFVWYDRGGWQDSTKPGSGVPPVQGSYNIETGKWIKGSSGKYTYDFFLDKLEKKIQKKFPNYKYDYLKRGWENGKADTDFKKKLKQAVEKAVKRARAKGADVDTGRVIGVATTYQAYDYFRIPSNGFSRDNVWTLGFYSKNKSYTSLFGNRRPSTKDKRGELMSKYGWKQKVKEGYGARAGESWYKYAYRMGYEDNKKVKANTGTPKIQFYIVAVADSEPIEGDEFSTSLVDLSNSGDGVKIDIKEPGNVKAKDEILYKNVSKSTYKVSADLKISGNVSLTDDDDVEIEDDLDIEDSSEFTGSTTSWESVDGVVTLDGPEITIDNESDNYNNYSGGSFWSVVVTKDSDNNWTNIRKTQELVELDTILDLSDIDEEEVWIGVYYKNGEPNIDDEDDPIVSSVFTNYKTSDDPDDTVEPDLPDTPIPEGTIIASVNKVSPVAVFKPGSGQKDWQRGSFINLKGKYNGFTDLYKEGLYNSVSDFTKEYKAGVYAKIYDGNTLIAEHNEDLEDAEEATKIVCPFGSLTFNKQTLYNFKKASVVETGATFQVYSKEFDSYDAAVADAQAKGYETYKYDTITFTSESREHGNITDHIKWNLHNGMLVPGTYVIKQTSSGDFSKSHMLIDPFEMTVEKQKVTSLSDTIENEPYTYDLTVEKRSANPLRSEWEPSTEDQLYSKLTKFKLESLDDKKNAMENGNGKSPTATNADESYLSSVGFTQTHNTDPWTISIKDLPSGRYKLTEDAPLGYWLPENKASVEFTVYRDMTGQVAIDDIKAHDAAFTKADVRKTETADKTSYAVTFTRSNVPQYSGTLKLHKDRESENAVGNKEKEGFPFVEFNLYANPDNPLTSEKNDGGDIRAYDGHKDHVYYKAGDLIQGIVIDEETGERTYYKDGKVVDEESYRIMTDYDGNWDSSKIFKDEKLVDGGDKAFEHYPLTNNNMIDTYNSDGTPTGEKDGVSFYKLQEKYVWQYGDHISFTDAQKLALSTFWTSNYVKEGTAYGSMDKKIPHIDLSMSQILNHGIDITENDSQSTDQSGRKTFTYSSFGKELSDDVVLSFLRDKVFQYVDPATGVNDTTETIMDKHNKAVGTIEYNLLVLQPNQRELFDLDNTYSEFQILPDNIDTTQYIDVQLQQFTNLDMPQIKTTASVNGTDSQEYSMYDKKVAIHDTVSYFNLNPGNEYTMIGSLYNIKQNENGDWELGDPILDANGNVLTESKKFTPSNKKGNVEIVFNVTPEQLNYRDIVVVEKCMLEDNLIAQEMNPAAKSQQISQGILQPEIKTEATYANKHIMPNDSEITFSDKVTCTNLKAGQTYTLRGILMDKKTKEPLKIDGKEITAEKTFEAKGEASEVVDIPFDINTKDLDGKTVVVFEELFIGGETKGKPIAEHKDIEDPAQSINIPAVETIAQDEVTKEHVGEKSETEKVTDTVKYYNVTKGDKYTIKGKLIRKSDQSVLSEASETFTAEDSNGTIVLTFTVNSKDLEGDSAVAFESLYDAETETLVGIHADINDKDQTINYPKIRTNAVDTNIQDHVGELGEKVSITDKVTYENLIPNLEYTLTGVLMDKETNEPLKVDGKEVTATQTFKPESSSGSYDLVFELDSTKISGKSVVAFEELTLNNALVAEHKDINDPKQTVNYPTIKTNADLISDNVIRDKVTYTNLVPNRKYVVEGKLMNKDTGKELEGVTAQASFTPTEPSGSINLDFKVDLSKVSGKSVVAFERLYAPNDKGEKYLVAKHEDINDKEQTVDIPFVELNVTIAKADAEKVKYFLKGAEITVFDKDGNIAKDKNGKQCVGLTDENGNVTFTVLYSEGSKYYAQETKAPKGYQINKDKFEVKPKVYDKRSVDISISILDKALVIPPTPTPAAPGTGDSTKLLIFILIAMAGFVTVLGVRRKLK